MNRTWAGVVALLSLLLASPLAAQPARELRGQVFHLGENGEKVVEPGLIVTLVETGATDDANDQGIFRLPLPPALQPGDSVTVSIDKPGWRIRFPLEGETRIPRDLRREIVPVELLQVGSKLFWTNDRIEKFIRDAIEHLKQERRQKDDAPSLDLSRDIKDWAAKYGFSAEEARKEIDRWIADVEVAHEDSYQKGLVAFAKQQFDTAAERFRDSAEWRIRQLAEARKQQESLAEKAERLQEQVVRDLRLQADAHYYAHRYEQALAVYEQAHQYTSKDQTPQLWGVTLNDIGRAHEQLGVRVGAVESVAHLAAAVQAHRQALLVLTREQLPQDWARTQTNLGDALTSQAKNTAGEEGAKLLAEAVQAHRQALLVYSQEEMPEGWARAQTYLGITLEVQAIRTVGEKKAELLAEAVQAYRKALLIYTRDQLPREWALLQTNLGDALASQGGISASGEEGFQFFDQSVQAYQQALLVFTREKMPQYWAWTQSSLGNALLNQARRTTGEESLKLFAQAEQAIRKALLVYTHEQLPQDWAWTQSFLGYTLRQQGKLTTGDGGTQLFAQSVQAYRQALLVYTHEQLPVDWALMQYQLGYSLQEQGKRTSGEAGAQLLAQALDACRQALLVLTPDQFSEWWADARSCEAEALLALHRYEEAADALSQVLVKELDASNRIMVLGYAIAASVAIDSPEVPDRVEELLGLVAAQPQDFSGFWIFDSLGEIPHNDLLIRLFQALKAPDRDSLLKGLREWRGALPSGRNP